MDENKMPENDGWKKNARLAIYAMAGFYLLTLAYQMFRAISTSHGNEQLVMIVATILFLIVIIGLVIIFKKQLNELVTKIFEKITNESSGI